MDCSNDVWMHPMGFWGKRVIRGDLVRAQRPRRFYIEQALLRPRRC